MKIHARIAPNSRKEGIEPGEFWRIRVNAPAREGKANARAMELLAGHFGVSVRRIRLSAGATAKNKTFEIL
jgi:uncharacterized protein